jgi:hypothetical protein
MIAQSVAPMRMRRLPTRSVRAPLGPVTTRAATAIRPMSTPAVSRLTCRTSVKSTIVNGPATG